MAHAGFMCQILCSFHCLTGILMACLPSEVKLKGQPYCMKTCPSEKYLFEQNCIDICPLGTSKFETDLGRYCMLGNEFSCQRPRCDKDYPFCYKMNCLSVCPEYTVGYKESSKSECLLQCPKIAPFLTAYECEGICLIGKKMCSSNCPESHPFVFSTLSFTHCLKKCPSYTVVSYEYMNCSSTCPVDLPFLFNNTCYANCPDGSNFIHSQKTKYSEIPSCVEVCPDNTVIDDNICVESCPKEKHLFNNTCVSTCPESQSYLYSKQLSNPGKDVKHFGRASFMCVKHCYSNLKYGNLCKRSCPSDTEFELNDTCIKTCPEDHPFYKRTGRSNKCVSSCEELYDNKTCVSFCPSDAKFEFNKSCLKECPDHSPFRQLLYFYNNERRWKCVQRCEYYYYQYGCVSSCPSEAKYRHNVSCVDECFGSLPYKLDKKVSSYDYEHICVDSCPAGTFFYKESKCMSNCPKDHNFQFNSSCQELCPVTDNYKVRQGTHYKCVNDCSNMLYFKTFCVSQCPVEARFRHNISCVEECNGHMPFEYSNTTKITVSIWQRKYRYETNYFCAESCPLNTMIYNETKCVTSCPNDRMFEFNRTCHEQCPCTHQYKLRKGSYYKCRDQCSDMYEYNMTCVRSCPLEAKYISNRSCVSACGSEREYSYNNISKSSSTYHCLEACPLDTYLFNMSCVVSCPKETFRFNSNCVYDCPITFQLNYTQNSVGYGIYQCVHKCPVNTYLHNNTCFDECPVFLKTHLSFCTDICPDSHPFTDIQSRKCLNVCQNELVIIGEFLCDNKCPDNLPFIENNQCVKNCQNHKALYEITEKGKVCYDQCPNHLLSMEGTCVGKCPEEKLIVGSACKNIDKCPFHLYVEHSQIGRRCTNICSDKFYLDGTTCVKECPPQKVIAGMQCEDTCPPSLPLSYKHFSTGNPRVKCYKVCPDGFLANGTKCIESYHCSSNNHFSYNHVCYTQCPYLTIESGYQKCASLSYYIALAVFCLVLIIGSLALLYVNTCFIGISPRKKYRHLQQEEDKINNDTQEGGGEIECTETDQGETKVLFENKTESVNLITELDDGYKLHKYSRGNDTTVTTESVQLHSITTEKESS